jgi:hypothetical protein
LKNADATGGFALAADTRALTVAVPGGYLWFWIGTHDAYERLLKDV